MNKIGLIGGMSWHSTLHYYGGLNTAVAETLGGHSSARIVLESLDFEEIRECQQDEDWARAGRLLAEAGRRCEVAGADVVAICTNLMHKVAPDVEGALGVPLVHIGDAVATRATAAGWSRLGVLGARWVMEDSFYSDRLATHGIATVTPGPADRELVDRVVFDELTLGRIEDASRTAYVEVIERLADQGAEAVVLACTEIGLLVGQADSPLPLIDSTTAHVDALASAALQPVPTR